MSASQRQYWGTNVEKLSRTYAEVGNYVNGFAYVRANNKFAFINEDGKQICPLKFDDVWAFSSNGIALVQQKGKYGFIDKNGKEVCPIKYDYISDYCSTLTVIPAGRVRANSYEPYHEYNNWCDGLAVIYLHDKVGLINCYGRVIVEPKYDFIALKSGEKYIPVKLDGKYGYIDKNGNEVTKIVYDKCVVQQSLTERTCISRNGRYGYIDERGQELCLFIYDGAFSFVDGIAIVRIGDKYGYINEQFEEICPVIYDYADRFINGFAVVGVRSWLGVIETMYIDKKGNRFKKNAN